MKEEGESMDNKEDFVDFASLDEEVEDATFNAPEGADLQTEKILSRLSKARFTSRSRTGAVATRLKDLEQRIKKRESK